MDECVLDFTENKQAVKHEFPLSSILHKYKYIYISTQYHLFLCTLRDILYVFI